MTKIDTERLILRLPEAADTRPLREIHQDPAVMKHTIILTTHPSDDTLAWRNIAFMVGHWQMRGYGHFTVVERATGAVIGRAGLYYPEGWLGVELGWIIRPARWGNGFATEAARAVLRWTWANTTVDHVISLIEPTNTQSIRIAHKLGEGLERSVEMDGKSFDVYGVERAKRT